MGILKVPRIWLCVLRDSQLTLLVSKKHVRVIHIVWITQFFVEMFIFLDMNLKRAYTQSYIR